MMLALKGVGKTTVEEYLRDHGTFASLIAHAQGLRVERQEDEDDDDEGGGAGGGQGGGGGGAAAAAAAGGRKKKPKPLTAKEKMLQKFFCDKW